MKKLVILVLFISFNVFAQITLTQQNLEANFSAASMTEFGANHELSESIDLGTASSTAQTFDFSNIFNLTGVDTGYVSYGAVNGQPAWELFPEATIVSQQDYIFPQFTMHLYVYFNITSDGICIHGMVNNQIIPGIMDTLYVQSINPYFLQYPVPFTIGNNKTFSDTIYYDGNVEYQIENHSWECNGFGELKLPDGSSCQSLRVIKTEIEYNYEESILVEIEKSVEVQFWTLEGNMLYFDVDSNYTGGATIPEKFHLSMLGGATALELNEAILPQKMVLEQNYPNPFNPSTTISYYLPEATNVKLEIFNVAGELIQELVNREESGGFHSVEFISSELSSGVYFYQLQTDYQTITNKMLLMK